MGGHNITETTVFYSRTNEVASDTGTESKLIDDEWTNVDLEENAVGNWQQDFWG